MQTRWAWLKRPRWQFAVGVVVLLIAWLLWPIKVYEIVGRTRGIGITLPGSSERTPRSIGVSPRYEAPSLVKERVQNRLSKLPHIRKVEGLGDAGYWFGDTALADRGAGQLIWVRGNFEFLQGIRGPFEGHEPGTAEWVAACERVAREIDAEFLAGRAGSREVRKRRIPRVVLWGLDQRRDWRFKQGLRTFGWW